MNQTTKVQISEEIQRILSDKTISQNQLAKKAGISASHLVNMKEPAKWTLVSVKSWQKAAAFFQKSLQWKTVTTDNFHLIDTICIDAHENQKLLALVGRSGLGKTTALKHYARQNSNAFYVLTDYLQKSKEFFRSIAQSMAIEAGGNARSMLQAIIDRIDLLESPLLILDDAGKLNDGNYRNIQLLYDATEGKLGIVLAGTPHLREYITKMTLKGKMGFDELKRRVQRWYALNDPTREEVEFICIENGIDKKDCINYLYNSCTEYGSIKAVITSARKRNKDVTVDLLIKEKGV